MAISIKPIHIFMNSENYNISLLRMNIISVEKIITSLQRDEVLLFFCKERLSIVVLLELFEGAD